MRRPAAAGVRRETRACGSRARYTRNDGIRVANCPYRDHVDDLVLFFPSGYAAGAKSARRQSWRRAPERCADAQSADARQLGRTGRAQCGHRRRGRRTYSRRLSCRKSARPISRPSRRPDRVRAEDEVTDEWAAHAAEEHVARAGGRCRRPERRPPDRHRDGEPQAVYERPPMTRFRTTTGRSSPRSVSPTERRCRTA